MSARAKHQVKRPNHRTAAPSSLTLNVCTRRPRTFSSLCTLATGERAVSSPCRAGWLLQSAAACRSFDRFLIGIGVAQSRAASTDWNSSRTVCATHLKHLGLWSKRDRRARHRLAGELGVLVIPAGSLTSSVMTM